MDNKLNKELEAEITPELLKELNIGSIEEYRFMVQDADNKSKKDSKKNKKSAKEIKISKSKIKENNRKKERVIEKKMKNAMRSKILESLDKHNKDSSKILESLDSVKNLGKKRKNSKDIKSNSRKTSKAEEIDLDAEMEESVDYSSDSESSHIEEIETTKEPKINTNEETNINTPVVNCNNPAIGDILDDKEFRRKLVEEIKAYRLEDDNLEEIENDAKLEIPVKSDVVLVKRDEEIQKERLELPIVKYEQEIMDKINSSFITLICGETGSGKSTQIPQFLYEYGYTNSLGRIAITQPRRVAAISLATRVARELKVDLGKEVGYQIRYDSHTSDKTVIKYLTDGILLKEIESDNLLSKYSVVIIDEAHERTINTDIIIGLLTKIVKFRYLLAKNKVKYSNANEREVKPLRVVIMSATMRVDEFMESVIFKPHLAPSFIKIEARRFPVTVYHTKRTIDDYIEEAYKTCCKIHRRLPDGAILIFLTGKQEINYLCDKLKSEFENPNINSAMDKNLSSIVENPDDEYDINIDEAEPEPEMISYKEAVVLPMYSSLTQEQQMKVFEAYPNKRLIVIATNVAETSLTIPGVKYVIDAGREKRRVFTHGLSFSTFNIDFVSQASAEQRTGRAGRTGPGFCYRLYSNGLFAKMEKYTEPQILKSPLDQTILYLKSIKIKNIYNFPFITVPDKTFIEKAIRHLIVLGALKSSEENSNTNLAILRSFIDKDYTEITNIGSLMVKFPLSPKYSKMIILGNKFGTQILNFTFMMISMMNIEGLFLTNNSDLRNILDIKMINPFSDSITYLNIFLTFLKYSSNESNIKKFCEKYYINIKKIKEANDLYTQLIKTGIQIFKIDENSLKVNQNTNYPNSEEQTILYQVLLSGFIDNVARRKVIYDQVGNKMEDIRQKRIIYESNENNEQTLIHPLSIVLKTHPDFIIYKDIIQENKTFLVCNTIVKPEWIYNIGSSSELVSYDIITNLNEPFYNKNTDCINCYINMKYGYKMWDIQNVIVEMNKEDDNYLRYFARFLLEGKIINEFKNNEKSLNGKPQIITNQISILPKVTMIIRDLKYAKVYTKKGLINQWKKDKK